MIEYPDHVIVCKACSSPIERFDGVWVRLDGAACSGAECAPLSVEDYDLDRLSQLVDLIATQRISELRMLTSLRSA